MVFVPLIGLSPFILYNLIKQRDIFKLLFFTGIFIGSIPTLFNLYFSYEKFGIIGITALFDFARKQAIGDFGFNNLILIPLNFLYLTFPIGILFLILFITFLSEFYLLRDFYKFKYARENRIYEMCLIPKYKNTLNYKINMNANSFIPLAKDPKAFTSRFNSKMDKEFFIIYCEQMKQKPSWKSNFFNIMIN